MSIKKPVLSVSSGGNPPSGHLEAIGRFVFACSWLEVHAHVVFRHYLGLPEATARLLIGQPKIIELLTLFKSVVEAEKRDPAHLARLELLVPEIDYINKIRAMVAHNIFAWTPKEFHFHDSAVQKKGTIKTRGFECTVRQLKDCATYAHRLGQQLRQLTRDDVQHQSVKALRETLHLPDPPEKQRPGLFLELVRRPRP